MVKPLLYFFIGFLILIKSGSGQTGSGCVNPFILYPAANCGNSYQGECPTYTCGYLIMSGNSILNPVCTADDETTQPVLWISVVANSGSFVINNQQAYTGGGPSALAADTKDYVVYSGTCGTLTELFCFPNVPRGGTCNVTGLTPGQTYMILCSPSSISGNSATAISPCITSSSPYVNSYGDCNSAYNLTTNVTYRANNAGNTSSGPICSGSVENDVWFKWCAPASWPAGQQAFINVNNQICNVSSGNVNYGLQLSVWNTGSSCPATSAAATIMCQNPGAAMNYYYQWTAVANSCYYITLDGFSGTACTFDITVGTNVMSVPLYLEKFEISGKKKPVLNWKISSDIPSLSYALIERSEGKDFLPAGKVSVNKNQEDYNWEDKNIFNNKKYFYRLKIMVGGKESDSQVLSFINEEKDILKPVIFFNERNEIEINAKGSEVESLEIFDPSGKLLVQKKGDIYPLNIFLEPGIYIARIISEGNESRIKFVKPTSMK